MAFNPMDMFQAGKDIGKSRKSPFAYGAEGVMDQFKTNQDTQSKLAGTLGMQMALKKYENELPQTPKDKAMTDYYKAKTDKTSGNVGRDIFLVNRRTGTITKAGDKTNTPVDPSTVGSDSRIMGVDIPSASSSSMYTSAEASTKQIDDLIASLKQPSQINGKPNPSAPNKFMGGLTGPLEMLQGTQNKGTQDYGLIRRDFSDRLLRLRSGAQINEQEYKRLMNMLPQWWRNTDSDVEQLNKFKTEYQNLMSRLSGQGGQLGGNFEDIEPKPNEDDDPAGLFS